MKVLVRAGVLIVLIALSASPAIAAISDLLAQVRETGVYIDPDYPGITPDSQAQFERSVNTSDHVVVVMLESSESAPREIATQIADELPNSIIGVAVGDKLIGYSDILPVGTANDLMDRADSVGTNNLETMNTFVRVVKSYEIANADQIAERLETTEEVAQPEEAPSTSSGTAPTILTGIGIAIAAAFIGVYVLFRRRYERNNSIADSPIPPEVEQQIDKIKQLSPRIHDGEFRQLVARSLEDVEEYFERSSQDVFSDGETIKRQLNTVREIVSSYIDIQDNPRYFPDRQQQLERAFAAVEGFEAFVMDAIRSGINSQLIDYEVDTSILSDEKVRGIVRELNDGTHDKKRRQREV